MRCSREVLQYSGPAKTSGPPSTRMRRGQYSWENMSSQEGALISPRAPGIRERLGRNIHRVNDHIM